MLKVNERYEIVEDPRELTKHPLDHPTFTYVYRATYSPNFGWRTYECKGKFNTKQEAETWVKENS